MTGAKVSGQGALGTASTQPWKVFHGWANRQFLSCPKPLFQTEAKCEAIDMKIIVYSHANETHFHSSKVFHLASFWKWEFSLFHSHFSHLHLNVGNCYKDTLLSFNVFNTVSHSMSVYLLSFGNVSGAKRGTRRGEGGRVSKREKGCMHAGHYGSNFLTFCLIRQWSAHSLSIYTCIYFYVILFSGSFAVYIQLAVQGNFKI